MVVLALNSANITLSNNQFDQIREYTRINNIKCLSPDIVKLIGFLKDKLYSIVELYEDDKTKRNLYFALKRFNRCMLRNEDDDMAIDATIGLESLLSGGTKGEITYTISNRIPIVFTQNHNNMYNPKVCRRIMKKIYNYRSLVVHGGTIKEKDKYYEINSSKVEIEKIAVDFLRYTLLFVLHNPEYLDAKKFDEFIDTIISDNIP